MKTLLALALAVLAAAPAAMAQSLKSEAPSPLQAGINKGILDNTIGNHYWFFDAQPGHVHIHCQFKSGGVLDNPTNMTVIFMLYDSGKIWKVQKPVSSNGKFADCTMEGDMKNPARLFITVAPPANGLIHLTGDYEIEATGAVAFAPPSNAEPIVGTYKQMNGYTTLLGDCKFSSDGSVQTTSGAVGNWNLFDKNSLTYIINIDGQERHSLQFIPGRGLCENDSTVFQLLR